MVSSIEPLLSLLQLTDSAIPIGGYSHSWGMETWVQNEVVKDRSSALEAIEILLTNSIASQDGIACGCAHRYCVAGTPEKLLLLNQYLSGGKWSKETYQASLRMGQRLIKLAVEIGFVSSFKGLESVVDIFSESDSRGRKIQKTHDLEFHHSVIFGWLAACADVTVLSAVSAYLQSSSNSLISACVRLIPLGHTDGQKLVVALRPLIRELAAQCSILEIDEISSFAPLNEAACHAHEHLYSRLFQS